MHRSLAMHVQKVAGPVLDNTLRWVPTAANVCGVMSAYLTKAHLAQQASVCDAGL